MSPGPTPRTEAAIKHIFTPPDGDGNLHTKAIVEPDVARQLERELAEANAQAARLAGALDRALDRMDRARNILTDGRPRPECNWGMLDSADLRKELAAWKEGRA